MNIQDWLGKNNKLGIDIWEKKYQYKNETFEEWLTRVSGGNEKLKQLIREKKFLFGGRILANRGLHKEGKKITYSNCYVINPPEDSIESIYDTAKKLARTYSYGGGCGIDISNLAPRGAKVNNAAESTSGAVSFMDTYSQVTGQIGQAGRRGALMISLDCHHPDLEEFLDVKTDLDKVTKANISVRITDDFMKAVVKDDYFTLSFTRAETGEKIEKKVKAKNLFYKLAKNNWGFAEPGCLFWDQIKTNTLLENIPEFEFAGVNPCAEEPLPAGGSCLLGSLNLNAFVQNDEFMEDQFVDAVNLAVIALNEVMEEGLPLHPLEEQRESVGKWRQIGLGIFGLADALINLELTYGSEEALEFCDKIGYILANTAIKTSHNIAIEKGSFTHYNKTAVNSSKFYRNNMDEDLSGLYNSQLLTIAPTGTISTMLGVSGGIEPIFANSYERKTQSLHQEDVSYKVYTPIVKEYMDKYDLEEEELPEWFVTAPEIDFHERIDMQAVWQKHIDASISSTVNVPNNFTIEDTFNLYQYAWDKQLKGITIYRDGCSREGVLTTDSTKPAEVTNVIPRGKVLPSSDELVGLKRKMITGCGSLHVETFFDPTTGELREIFLSKGSTGGCNSFMAGLSREISLAARLGASVDDIVDQLLSTPACPSFVVRTATKKDTSKGSSCPMTVGYAIKDMWEQFQRMNKISNNSAEEVKVIIIDKSICPNCGEHLIFEGGCNVCKSCGWTKCD